MTDSALIYSDFFADLCLRKSSEGGKSLSLKSGYGCMLRLKPAKDNWECRLFFEHPAALNPGGEYVHIGVGLLSPDIVMPGLYVGQEFELWEGQIIKVADGKVVELC